MNSHWQVTVEITKVKFIPGSFFLERLCKNMSLINVNRLQVRLYLSVSVVSAIEVPTSLSRHLLIPVLTACRLGEAGEYHSVRCRAEYCFIVK